MNDLVNMLKMFIGKGGNIEQFLTQNIIPNNNPMLNNLVKLARNGNEQDIQNFARNMCKERGINFDTEFSKFLSNFKR